MYPVPLPVPLYPAFAPTAPIIPKMYWDAITPEQQVHRLCKELHKLCEYSNALAEALNLDHQIIDKLEADFTQFMESGFDDYYKQQVAQWIASHLEEITQSFVERSVYFGLTSDGYFCAYIPESWSDITFDTGMVYGRDDYGRLILRFTVDGRGVIDNRP